MTESEAYELIMLITSELNTLMFGYFSMISAFLIMSYLVAEKLSTLHSLIVVSLFTVASVYVVLNTYALNTDLDSLYVAMLAGKESGQFDLNWFGKNPIWVPISLTFVQVLVGLGGYVASLLFFFSQRRST